MRERPPIFRAFDGELVVDNFAGAGGASSGIEAALGRPVDIAINHSPHAIAMHKANHPETRHYCEDIWQVDPREACGSRPVGLAWFSPACTHFSRAKGAQNPRCEEIRGLAWVVIRWAETVAPRVIILENVEEFATWGPLDENGHPDKGRAGETFRAWLAKLTDLGYSLEFRSLVAADYGAPTTRKRLFLIARRDRSVLAWPEPTHGKNRPHPWRTAAEIIDWSLPCPSIFARRKPLAEATQRRIAVGIERYVLNTAQPFIVPVTHPRDARVHSIDEPVRTITAANRGELALVAPSLIQTSYGERKGQAPRVLDLHKPLGTVVAGGQKHGLVAAFLAKHYGGVVGHGLERPIGTVTSVDHHALVAGVIVKQSWGEKPCSGLAEPLHTITTQHNRFAEVRAFLTKFYGTSIGSTPQLPLPTVTTGGNRGGGHLGLVMIHGEPYAIADIGMRMLAPHELFAAQGFPADYNIAPLFQGKPLIKTVQIALAGNSVCPDVAQALVAANAYGREDVAA